MKIVLIGSGNIASHLGQAFINQGDQILQIYSFTKANADALALRFHAHSTSDLATISTAADLYLIAVKDDAIAEVVEQLPSSLSGIVVHCSGATDISILNKFSAYGVIYPPQSISKQLALDLHDIPFCIEGNTAAVESQLLSWIQVIAPLSIPCNSAQRLALHLSAVLVNNFTNVLFQMANELMDEYKLPFNLLYPIISETAKKAQNQAPKDVQTGPAKRNDQLTMKKHLDFISQKKEIKEIYQLLSAEIIKRNK